LATANHTGALRTTTFMEQPGRGRGSFQSQHGQAQQANGEQFFHDGNMLRKVRGQLPPSTLLMAGVRP
jgi:hypothetical protein